MFIYFLALSPACYMHPICRWEGFLTLFWAPPRRFCTLMHFLFYTAHNNPEKTHNIGVKRRNSHLKHRPENDSDMQ